MLLCVVALISLAFLISVKNQKVTIRMLFIALFGFTSLCTSLIVIGFTNNSSSGGNAGIYCFAVLALYEPLVLAPAVLNVGNELILKTLFRIMQRSDLVVFYEKRRHRINVIKVFFVLVCACIAATSITIFFLENEALIVAWRVLCASLASGLITSIYFLQYILEAFAMEIESIVTKFGEASAQQKMLDVARQCRCGRNIVILCLASPISYLLCASVLPMFWYILLTQVICILLGVLGMIVVFLPPSVKERFHSKTKVSSSGGGGAIVNVIRGE